MIMPRTNVENATITAQDVFYGTINGANVIKGRHSIPNPYIVMDNLEIEGLEPATDYIMYSVLKGTPADPSPLYINRFRTKDLVPPTITNILVLNDENAADAVTIQLTVDKTSTLYYVVYPAATSANGYAGGQINAEQIKNGYTEPSNQPLVRGQQIIEVDPEVGLTTVDIPIKGLRPGVKYIFHAVARNYLGTSTALGYDSEVKWSDEFGALDLIPPSITIGYNVSPWNTGDSDELYSGSVTVSSDEALYYMGRDGSINPLTYEVLLNNLDVTPKSGEIVLDTQGRSRKAEFKMTKNDITMSVARDMEGRAVGEGISSFTLNYTNIHLGEGRITFPYPICDVEGNAIPNANGGARGTLSLVFRERAILDYNNEFREYRPSWEETGLDENYVTVTHPFG